MDGTNSEITKLKLELRHRLANLHARADRDADFTSEESEASTKLSQLQNLVERFKNQLSRATPSQRETFRPRFDDHTMDLRELESGFSAYLKKRNAKEENLRRRAELLNQPMESLAQDTSIFIDAQLDENSRLESANTHMDQILGTARGILVELGDQRELMKGLKTRLLNVTSKLGLSQTIMRLIERRNIQDKFILFGGMIISTFIMASIYYYVKY